MGELFGIPEWLARTLFVAAFLAIVFGSAGIVLTKARTRLAARRTNPTYEEFMALMRTDVGVDTAQFLWDTVLPYVKPQLTPHPDDELANDLCIYDGDWSMDWPREYAERRGFHDSNLPDWPEGWPVTVRNFGRWLDMGPVA